MNISDHFHNYGFSDEYLREIFQLNRFRNTIIWKAREHDGTSWFDEAYAEKPAALHTDETGVEYVAFGMKRIPADLVRHALRNIPYEDGVKLLIKIRGMEVHHTFATEDLANDFIRDHRIRAIGEPEYILTKIK